MCTCVRACACADPDFSPYLDVRSCALNCLTSPMNCTCRSSWTCVPNLPPKLRLQKEMGEERERKGKKGRGREGVGEGGRE